MKVGWVGLGKLGLPCALAIESKGYEVLGYDVSPTVIEIVRKRKIPYREEGAQELLEKSHIHLTSLKDIVRECELIFVAIQTPHHEKYEGVTRLPDERVDFDYTYLIKGIEALADEIAEQHVDRVVIIVSTVLPTTIRTHIKPLLNEHVKLCYNPFFIAMGTCIRDLLNPEFNLFGVDDEEAARKAEAFYRTINNAPFYRTTVENAELIKVAYNTFIGMKIVFANTLMEICHKTGCDVDVVTDGLKLATDRVISPKYLSGGLGDGGGCHPRDNIALSWLARKLGLSYDWFESVMNAREKQTEWLANLMDEYPLPKVILGKAFKPETNIIVGSPAILLKNILEERGHSVIMYDPHVDMEKPNFKSSVFLIGTKHPEWIDFPFPQGSVVIDPWRYIPRREGVQVIYVGGEN